MIPALDAFEGGWNLDRSIDDRKTGQAGRFLGEATFTPGDKGLIYREEGLLTLGAAAPLVATRSYLWRADGAGGIEVLFEDGRPFHGFGPDAGPEASHWCDPDTYHVTYDFAPWPDWSATWSVAGPSKAYRMVARYARPPRHG